MAIGEQLASIMNNDVVASAAKVAPPVSAAGAIYMGITLPDLLMVATLIYTCLQVYVLIRDKFWRRNHHRKE